MGFCLKILCEFGLSSFGVRDFICFSGGCSLVWSRSFWPRGTSLIFAVALSFGEVDLCDHEACEFIFYSALLVEESILWTLWHEFIWFPFWWVLTFRWSRCLWPCGRFIFCSVVSLLMGALMRWSRCCGSWGNFIFYSVGHPLTSGL